jgi:hypothetical protein
VDVRCVDVRSFDFRGVNLDVPRYQRQLLLAPIGGAGQEKIRDATIVLHGDAPLCATYLAAAGLGCLRVTGELPAIASHDASFRLERGTEGDFVLDLGDGTAWKRAPVPKLWGGVVDGVLKLGGEPEDAAVSCPAMEILAAGEALWRILGREPHVYEYPLEPPRESTRPGKGWRSPGA